MSAVETGVIPISGFFSKERITAGPGYSRGGGGPGAPAHHRGLGLAVGV
jgi:hypothetical protein